MPVIDSVYISVFLLAAVFVVLLGLYASVKLSVFLLGKVQKMRR